MCLQQKSKKKAAAADGDQPDKLKVVGGI